LGTGSIIVCGRANPVPGIAASNTRWTSIACIAVPVGPGTIRTVTVGPGTKLLADPPIEDQGWRVSVEHDADCALDRNMPTDSAISHASLELFSGLPPGPCSAVSPQSYPMS
jgi:hypothetical protein